MTPLMWIALGLLAWTLVPLPLAILVGRLLGRAGDRHGAPAATDTVSAVDTASSSTSGGTDAAVA